MAILILATLLSPFLPQAYATFPPLWLLTLLAATQAPTMKWLIIFLLGWLSLNIMIPVDSELDPRLVALISSIPQTVTLALALLALKQWNQFSVVTPASQVEITSQQLPQSRTACHYHYGN